MPQNDDTVHRIRCQEVPELQEVWKAFDSTPLPRVGSASALFNNEQNVIKEIKALGQTCFSAPPIKQAFDRTWAFQFNDDWNVHLGRLSLDADKALNSPLALKIKSIFGDSGQLSGFFYYPPGGFKEWHTDYEDPMSDPEKKWRVYMVRTTKDNKSWFQYYGKDKKIRKIMDRNAHMNLFNLTETPPLWHGVFSNTHRWSIGIKLDADVIHSLIQHRRVP